MSNRPWLQRWGGGNRRGSKGTDEVETAIKLRTLRPWLRDPARASYSRRRGYRMRRRDFVFALQGGWIAHASAQPHSGTRHAVQRALSQREIKPGSTLAGWELGGAAGTLIRGHSRAWYPKSASIARLRAKRPKSP